MTDADRGQPVEVRIGGCRCPGDPRPHPDGDVVYLAPRAGLRLGMAAQAAIANARDQYDLAAELGIVFVRYGIIAWNLVDLEDGKVVPLPVSPATIDERLEWEFGGEEVADRAAELYGEAVVSPLQRRRSTSQALGPMDGSTSAPSPSPEGTPISSMPSSASPQETPAE